MSLVQIVGWTGRACFFGRFLVQWLVSERAQQVGNALLHRWFHLFENHVPVPAGLTLITVAQPQAAAPG